MALWASVYSESVQDRLFGAKPSLPVREPEPNPDPWILSYFDRGSTRRIEDQCKGDRYFVDYRVDGFFLDVRAEVFVDGDHVLRRRPRQSDGQWPTFETLPRKLTQDELFALWRAVESMHSLGPPPKVPPQRHVDAFEGGAIVSFAVCQGGNLWTAIGNGSEPDSAAMRASAVFEPFKVLSKRSR